MSRLQVTKDGKTVKLRKEYQKIWREIENGAGVPHSTLQEATACDLPENDIIQNIALFLACSNEMLGAYYNSYRYIFGDVDCIDMEDEPTICVRVIV